MFKNSTSIGCDEEHIFCKQCLDKYFEDGSNSQCPSCREQVNKSKMRASKFTDRIVKNLKVKCKLNYEQNKNSTNNDDIKRCDWEDQLKKLSTHMNEDCPLFVMNCPNCNVEKKRFQMKEHDDICTDKLIKCELKCG